MAFQVILIHKITFKKEVKRGERSENVTNWDSKSFIISFIRSWLVFFLRSLQLWEKVGDAIDVVSWLNRITVTEKFLFSGDSRQS